MFRRLIVMLASSLFWVVGQAQPLLYQEGTHYYKISPTQPTQVGPDKVEVIEAFSYACIHCAHFEPLVNNWKKTLPKQVSFSYLPVIFNATWELFARAYYAAELLGVAAKIHQPMFDAVFMGKMPITTMDDIAAVFASFGKTADEVKKMMNSMGVEMKIEQSKKQVLNYQIDGTPTMIVNGKWRVTGRSAGSPEEVLKVVNYLIQMETSRLAKSTPVIAKPVIKPIAVKS